MIITKIVKARRVTKKCESEWRLVRRKVKTSRCLHASADTLEEIEINRVVDSSLGQM